MLIAEIAHYLQSKGIGMFEDGGPGGDIFLLQCPSLPDDLVYITSTSGPSPDSEFPVDRPTVQFIVRAVNVAAADNKAQAIYKELIGFHTAQFVDGGTWIVNCTAINAPVYMGIDDLGRHEYSLNFQLETINNTAHRAWIRS